MRRSAPSVRPRHRPEDLANGGLTGARHSVETAAADRTPRVTNEVLGMEGQTASDRTCWTACGSGASSVRRSASLEERRAAEMPLVADRQRSEVWSAAGRTGAPPLQLREGKVASIATPAAPTARSHRLVHSTGVCCDWTDPESLNTKRSHRLVAHGPY